MFCKGLAVVLSAPSGAGKTTVAKQLVSAMSPHLCLSVSYTTRPKRTNEVDEVDYHFVNAQQFEDMIQRDDFLEWAQIHDYLYGSSLHWVRNKLHKGHNVLLIVDVQGAEQLKKRLPNCLLVFMVPPSLKCLEQRLRERNTESLRCIEQRLQAAHYEVRFGLKHYDYVIINDQLESTKEDLQTIIRAQHLLRVDREELRLRLLS